MDLTSFGIEFETCVCDTSQRHVNIETYRNQLQRISDTLGVGATFEYSPDPSYTNYGVWMVTVDHSIHCGIADSKFVSAGKRVDKIDDCMFSGVEVVSPKTPYTKDGYSTFMKVLNYVILNQIFSYDINKSQGMHINVSHPDQDKLRMLKAWWYFEPVIQTFIPIARRSSRFAIALRERFKTITDLVDNWEEFYIEPEIPPAKYSAVCVKPNRFEIRIVPATMDAKYVNAWLTFCVRFLFASIIKSVDFDFTVIPTVQDIFQFINVDPSMSVSGLAAYFYSIDMFQISYYMLELIKSGDEAKFRKRVAESPANMLVLLKGSVPILPSLNLLKFFRILGEYIEIDEDISEIFDANMISITRAYNPAFYRDYVYFADYDLGLEILKTAVEHKDCETVNAISQHENFEIDWNDILEFDSEWLVECYQNPLPPDDMSDIKSWRVARAILEKYPEINLDVFMESWIEPSIISEQFEIISKSNDVSLYSGFEEYTIKILSENGTLEITTQLMPIIFKIIDVYNAHRISDIPLGQYLNNIFLCENAYVNSFLKIYVLEDNVELCQRIIGVYEDFLNHEQSELEMSSELLNNCLRVIPREQIIGKYRMIDEILSINQ